MALVILITVIFFKARAPLYHISLLSLLYLCEVVCEGRGCVVQPFVLTASLCLGYKTCSRGVVH